MISVTTNNSKINKLRLGDLVLVRGYDHTTVSQCERFDIAGREQPCTIEFVGRFLNADKKVLRLHSLSTGDKTGKDFEISDVGEVALIPMGTIQYIGRLSGDPERPRRPARHRRSRTPKG